MDLKELVHSPSISLLEVMWQGPREALLDFVEDEGQLFAAVAIYQRVHTIA